MKNVQQIVLALVIITAAGITSCRKSALPEPAAKTAAGDTAGTQLNGLIPAAKFRLTKQGNTYLHYQSDGKLWKVVYSPTNYIEYSWGLNGVVATNYIDNKKYSTNTIMINANGKCYYSTFRMYKDGFETSKWSWKYEYFNNQLFKQVNPDNANERYEFIYKDGNLEKINYYSSQGILTNTATYKYELAFISPKIDKNLINPETAEIEQYLQLYSKFSEYLPMSIKRIYIPTNTTTKSTVYSYSLNENGYVKTRQWREWGILKETAEYQYQQIR